MHATHTGNAARAAFFALIDSASVPNSTLDSDGHLADTLIPPCWTKAELIARPFFLRIGPDRDTQSHAVIRHPDTKP